jgi:hypothetical protein
VAPPPHHVRDALGGALGVVVDHHAGAAHGTMRGMPFFNSREQRAKQMVPVFEAFQQLSSVKVRPMTKARPRRGRGAAAWLDDGGLRFGPRPSTSCSSRPAASAPP